MVMSDHAPPPSLTGLEYVFERRLNEGRPSIINMSYGGQNSHSEIMDLALMRVRINSQ